MRDVAGSRISIKRASVPRLVLIDDSEMQALHRLAEATGAVSVTEDRVV